MERVRFSIRVERRDEGDAGSKAGCAPLTVDAVRAALTAVLPSDLVLVELSCETSEVWLSVSGGPAGHATLRSLVLSGELDGRLAEKLQGAVTCCSHRTAFAEAFEAEKKRSMEQLTTHQREQLEAAGDSADVHLRAPAGAGKTLWALHRLLGELRREDGGLVVFVARNAALALFAARWLVQRSSSVGRLRLAHAPLVEGCARRVHVSSDTLELGEDLPTSAVALLCVDEAHHVFGDPRARRCVEAFSPARRLLLSDESQSHAAQIVYPRCKEIQLTEVVRSSKRVVAGAMAFQLGGEKKLLTTCTDDCAGPPLKSFLFDIEGDKFEEYARQTVLAIEHVQTTLEGMRLDDRLAIVVPDEQFRLSLLGPLSAKISMHLVEARTACARLTSNEQDWVVLDSIGEMDGLERLVVICVGLDSEIEDNAGERRSMLYRGLTRAQLVVVVVNEFLPGGWLEFLASLKLGDAFDADKEVDRAVCAAEAVVGSDLASALEHAALMKHELNTALLMDADVKAALAREASKLVERGLELDNAASSVMATWRSELAMVLERVRRKVQTTEEEFYALARTATLALRRGAEANLETAVSKVVAKWSKTRLEARIDAHLLTQTTPFPCCEKIRKRLRAQIAESIKRQHDEDLTSAERQHGEESLLTSATAGVLSEWRSLYASLLQHEESLIGPALLFYAEGAAFGECYSLASRAATNRRLGDLIKSTLGDSASTRAVDCLREHLTGEEEAVTMALHWKKTESAARKALQRSFKKAQLDLTPETQDDLAFDVAKLLLSATTTSTTISVAVDEATRVYAESKRQHDERNAVAGAALAARARSERRRLTAKATTKLCGRVVDEMARADVDAAVDIVWVEYERSLAARLVSQTIWDSSANTTTRAAETTSRFMPFGGAAHHYDYETLLHVFGFLRFDQDVGVLSLVCKRWRSSAADPYWKPDVVMYAWGDAELSGLEVAAASPRLLKFSLAHQIVAVTVSDAATFALTHSGQVYHWGENWADRTNVQSTPKRIEELRDVTMVACSPSGYHHHRSAMPGFSCLALTRNGHLYTWGSNADGQLSESSHARDRHSFILRPRRYGGSGYLEACCGIDFLTFQRNEKVYTAGSFCGEEPCELTELVELRGLKLRSLKAGSFHCCALTTTGIVYTFGDESGADLSNGNLLGHGPPGQIYTDRIREPRALQGIPPIVEVCCSTYTTLLVAADGRCFSFGDSDGDALGHDTEECNSPTWLTSLRGHHCIHGALSYTNAAVTTTEGRIFVWGGNSWEGGIAEGRNTSLPTEVKHAKVPPCYRSSAVALSHKHGYLIFELAP